MTRTSCSISNKCNTLDVFHFDNERHVYTLNGVVIPSVTQLLTPLTQSEYAHIDKKILEIACKRGTQIHKLVEQILNGEDCDLTTLPPQWFGYYYAFSRWYNEHSEGFVSKVHSTELTTWGLYNGVYYGGTIDVLGDSFIIDIKTRDVKKEIDILQLMLYNNAIMGSMRLNEFRDLYILGLSRDGKYRFSKLVPTREDISIVNLLTEIYKKKG